MKFGLVKNDRNCREIKIDKYYGFLIITDELLKSNTFTFENKCVTMNKVFLDGYTYSSGDRAPPSGGGCGGSNPPRCASCLGTRVCKQTLIFMLRREKHDGVQTGF